MRVKCHLKKPRTLCSIDSCKQHTSHWAWKGRAYILAYAETFIQFNIRCFTFGYSVGRLTIRPTELLQISFDRKSSLICLGNLLSGICRSACQFNSLIPARDVGRSYKSETDPISSAIVPSMLTHQWFLIRNYNDTVILLRPRRFDQAIPVYRFEFEMGMVNLQL